MHEMDQRTDGVGWLEKKGGGGMAGTYLYPKIVSAFLAENKGGISGEYP